jgi:transcriptional regulator with XRE-family HTH domain
MEIREKLAQNIIARRNELGLSQEDLAGIADLDRTYISGLERRRRNPTLKVLEKLAAALERKPYELIK